MKAGPHHPDAEKVILATWIFYPDSFRETAEKLSPNDFFLPLHRKVAKAIFELAREGKPPDLVLVAETLRNNGAVDPVSFAAMLDEVIPSPGILDHYVSMVREASGRRQIIAALHESITEVATPNQFTTEEHIAGITERIFKLGSQTRNDIGTSVGIDRVLADIRERRSRKTHVYGVPTGFDDLDLMTGGLHAGHLSIIAARPGLGKTSLALCIALNAANQGTPVGIFSLEMSSGELLQRALSVVSRVDGHRLRTGLLPAGADEKLKEAADSLKNLPLFIDDAASLDIGELSLRVRRLKATHSIGLVIVDYLQLMRVSKSERRDIAIGEISRCLKLLAKEAAIPVMALSQLNRSIESRERNRPRLSDLRDSGALEQDADEIAFLHRDKGADHREVILLLAKNRQGPTGEIELQWSPEFTKFSGPLRVHRKAI